MSERTTDLEQLAAELEATGDFRVLRRLRERSHIHEPDQSDTKIGVLLDTETTGIDTERCELIELGMVRFEYCPTTGRIFRLLDTFAAFQEPADPIPAEITQLTGITDDMVAGHTIDPLQVAGFVNSAVIVIAHNAGFDRKIVERYWPCFATKGWACSQNDIDWRTERVAGAKLDYLLTHAGLFHSGHRAVEDCRALLEVLARPLPLSGDIAFKRLLEAARQPCFRIHAEYAPYDLRGALKTRGYRWNGGENGSQKAWWIDVAAGHVEAELDYLRNEIYQYPDIEIPVRRISAFDRYSSRI